MYLATLTMTGMLAFPASASTVTVTGATSEPLTIAGTAGPTISITGTRQDGLTIDAVLTLSAAVGGA